MTFSFDFSESKCHAESGYSLILKLRFDWEELEVLRRLITCKHSMGKDLSIVVSEINKIFANLYSGFYEYNIFCKMLIHKQLYCETHIKKLNYFRVLNIKDKTCSKVVISSVFRGTKLQKNAKIIIHILYRIQRIKHQSMFTLNSALSISTSC